MSVPSSSDRRLPQHHCSRRPSRRYAQCLELGFGGSAGSRTSLGQSVTATRKGAPRPRRRSLAAVRIAAVEIRFADLRFLRRSIRIVGDGQHVVRLRLAENMRTIGAGQAFMSSVALACDNWLRKLVALPGDLDPERRVGPPWERFFWPGRDRPTPSTAYRRRSTRYRGPDNTSFLLSDPDRRGVVGTMARSKSPFPK